MCVFQKKILIILKNSVSRLMVCVPLVVLGKLTGDARKKSTYLKEIRVVIIV